MNTVPHPTSPSAPSTARHNGTAPFLNPGDQVDWHYRKPGWSEGEASNIAPMRVVRDDERGLIAWLAPGTRLEGMGAPDGQRIRTVPLAERWLVTRTRIVEEWWGNGVLRIAPAGTPWSVWLFWSAANGADWDFAGWYVNLENAHLRSGTSTYSSDHILDVEIAADGTIGLKDEDELEEAVLQGRLSPTEAAVIRQNADAAITSFRRDDWPFDLRWTRWRPESSWTMPELIDLPD